MDGGDLNRSSESPIALQTVESAADLAARIDHTLLKPDTGEAEIRAACEEAKKFQYAAVCVRPENVALTARLLQGARSLPITVIGFPQGTTSTESKRAET